MSIIHAEAKDQIQVFVICLILCAKEQTRQNTFKGLIASVNNRGFPVLHFIMGRTGCRPFHQTEINKGLPEPGEAYIAGKWALYEEDYRKSLAHRASAHEGRGRLQDAGLATSISHVPPAIDQSPELQLRAEREEQEELAYRQTQALTNAEHHSVMDFPLKQKQKEGPWSVHLYR